MRFEKAVIQALGTLPPKCWQRVDGLMCESPVLNSPDRKFRPLRLWLMERRGVIESNQFGSYWPSLKHMKSYRLKSEDGQLPE